MCTVEEVQLLMPVMSPCASRQPVDVPRDAAKALVEACPMRSFQYCVLLAGLTMRNSEECGSLPRYLERVPAQIARGANGWSALEALMAEDCDEGR